MFTARKVIVLFTLCSMILVFLVIQTGPTTAAPEHVNPAAPDQLSPAAPATSLTLIANKDAYIDQSNPDKNYGGDPSLWVGLGDLPTGGLYELRTLVGFDLSAVPAGATVLAAKLQLYQISALDAANYSILPDRVTRPNWDEPFVTWNNQPAGFVNDGDPAVATDLTNGWKTWDVTNIVNKWLDPKAPLSNYGILLKGDGQTLGRREFGSRDGDPLLAPRLILRYSLTPVPTRTPVPTWTPVPTAVPPKGTAVPTLPPVPIYAYLPPPIPIYHFLLPTFDLSIAGIEVTEAIQCFNGPLTGCTGDNSLPLISKKDATARIYLKYAGSPGSSMNNVPVRLHLYANGVWYVVNATGQARATLDQSNAAYSANVWFNVDFNSNVDVRFWAEVDPDHTIAETIEGNNCYPTPSDCSGASYFTLTFQKRGTFTVVGQRLRYHPGGYAGNQYAGGWAVNGGGVNWWNAVMPVRTNGINYYLASGYLDWTTSLGDGAGQHALISALNMFWIQQNALSWWFGTGSYTGARHVYGWAPAAGYSGGHADMPIYPHAGGLGVVGIGSDAPGVNVDNPGSGALIFAHELTHDYNVYHTDTSDACGSNDPNSDFPYSSSSIQKFGFNPDTGKVYDPATTHDLMSYCPSGGSKQGWISPFTWKKMAGPGMIPAALAARPAAQAMNALQPNTFYTSTLGEALAVHVTISNPISNSNQYGGFLGDLTRIEPALTYLPEPGDYSIQLRDGPDVLVSQTFTVSFQSEYSAHGSSVGDPSPTAYDDAAFIMPWAEGTTSIDLIYGGKVLDSRAVSLHTPVVTITDPTAVVTWTSGLHDLKWNATDLDGDPLTYSVLFSHDGGVNWQLLTTGITSTTYLVDADSMAGSNDARFRVVASDGVNIGFDETPNPIVIPNKPPVPLITNPVTGTVFAPGELVLLQGLAIDLEDGTLPGSALSWSSDRQGGLGIGSTDPMTGLVRGPNLITLTAMDSYGITSTTNVSIYIGYRSYLPTVVKNH